MSTLLRPLLAAMAAMFTLAMPVQSQPFSPEQRTQIEQIVKDYLIANPEVLRDAMNELEKRAAAQEADRQKKVVRDNAPLLFNSKKSVTIGNPNGDVTLVEFFDYNCGYCKRALSDLMDLMKADPKLKVVLKEFPVLGQGSQEAALVAAAVKLQDPDNSRYLNFHQKLMAARGPADKAKALAAAKEAGFDVARIEKDIPGQEVRAIIEESLTLARTLGLNGTPSYVVGDEVVIGAVGFKDLKALTETVRKCGGNTSC